MIVSNHVATNSTAAHKRRFSPRQIANLVWWADVSDLSTVTYDGSNNISALRSKGDLSLVGNQGTTLNMPSLVVNSIRNLPGIRVQTGQRLQLASRYTEVGDLTMLRVASRAGALFVWHDNTNSTSSNTVALSPLYWSGWPGFNSPIVTGGSPNITSGVWSGPSALVFRRFGTASDFWIDSARTTRTIATTDLLIDFVVGGLQTNLASDYVIYEDLIFNRALTDGEIDGFQRYFRNKWGTP